MLKIEPCFCGNIDIDEFIIKNNKMTCLCCNTVRFSSTTRTIEEMIGVWNTRGVCPIDLNQTKAQAISEMIRNMPAIGFRSEREKNNWIGDYIHDLENN
jgi:hypothetical protein